MSEDSVYEITRRAAAAVTRRHSFLMMGELRRPPRRQ